MTPEELERLRIVDRQAPGPLPIIARRQIESDFPRIARDWIKSVRPSRAYGAIPNEVYHWWQHQLVESCWVDPTCGWIVACNPADPDQIYGWLCGQRAETLSGSMSLLHYVYVARPYRRVGLAARLLRTFDGQLFGSEPSVLVITADTGAGRELLDTLHIPVLYNPYLLWGRSAVPRPGGKRMARRADPIVQSRRNNVIAGFKPGATAEEEEEHHEQATTDRDYQADE